MSIGRLDEKSEGLLLLTTDGKVSAAITGNKVEKEYYVQVDGMISEQVIQQMREGVEIKIHSKIYRTKECKVEILAKVPRFDDRPKLREERHGPTSWISITLTEGKFRQVRKMTAAVGFPTVRLVRVRVGAVKLQGLKAGACIEVEQLNYT